MARRREQYEIKHPETSVGVAVASSRWDARANVATALTADTANKTGLSERAVRRGARRGSKSIPKAIDAIEG